MPRKISEGDVSAALNLCFRGYRFPEVAKRIGISSRTVRDRMNGLKERAKEVGIVSAAREAGVEIDHMLKVSREMRDKGVDVDDCVIGLNIYNVLTDLGVTDMGLRDWLLAQKAVTDSKNISPEEYVENLNRLKTIHETSGLEYGPAVAEYQRLADGIETLTTESKEQQTELTEIQSRVKEALVKEKVNQQNIDDYVKTRSRLRTVGVELADVEAVHTLIDNLTVLGYDPEECIAFYQTTVDAVLHQRELVDKNRSLEQELTEVEEGLRDQSDYLASQKEMATAVKHMEGIDPTAVEGLLRTVERVAAKHEFSRAAAFNRIREDFEQYDTLLGLGKERDRTQGQVNLLQTKLSNLQEEITENEKRLELQDRIYQNRESTMTSLDLLNQEGVGNPEIVDWHSILEENNLDTHTLRNEIRKLGGLKVVVNEKRKVVTELEEKEKTITSRIDAKEQHLNILNNEAEQTIQKTVHKNLETAKAAAAIINNIDRDLLDPETGLIHKFNKLTEEQEAEFKKVMQLFNEDQNKELETSKEFMSKTRENIEYIYNKACDLAQTLGELGNLRAINKLISGEKIAPPEERVAVTGIFILLDTHFLNNGYPNMSTQIRRVESQYVTEWSRRNQN